MPMNDRVIGLFDMLGPVMIGPSSSHTAGVARIAFLARKILGAPPDRARVLFYGSLARTYKGHGSDKAAIAGLLGILPEDERLAFAPELAAREGIAVEIVPVYDCPERYHPNTVVLELGAGVRSLRVRGASVGGGEILLQSVDGFEAQLDARLDSLLVLHHDEPGVIARVAATLAAAGINIASLASRRKDRGDEALIVAEVDGEVDAPLIAALEALNAVRRVVHVPSIRA
jgi:L-serine dehydratase